MVLQSTGPIKFSEVQTEFGGTNPISMSEYYRDSTSNYTTTVIGIPRSNNPFNMAVFYGKKIGTLVTYSLNSTAYCITSNFGNDYNVFTFFVPNGSDYVDTRLTTNINVSGRVYAIGAGGSGGGHDTVSIPQRYGGGGGGGAIRYLDMTFEINKEYWARPSNDTGPSQLFVKTPPMTYTYPLYAIYGGNGGAPGIGGIDGANGGGAGGFNVKSTIGGKATDSVTIYRYGYFTTYTNSGIKVGNTAAGKNASDRYGAGGGGGAGTGGTTQQGMNGFTVIYNGYRVGTFSKGGNANAGTSSGVNYGDGADAKGGRGKAGAIIIILPKYG